MAKFISKQDTLRVYRKFKNDPEIKDWLTRCILSPVEAAFGLSVSFDCVPGRESTCLDGLLYWANDADHTCINFDPRTRRNNTLGMAVLHVLWLFQVEQRPGLSVGTQVGQSSVFATYVTLRLKVVPDSEVRYWVTCLRRLHASYPGLLRRIVKEIQFVHRQQHYPQWGRRDENEETSS